MSYRKPRSSSLSRLTPLSADVLSQRSKSVGRRTPRIGTTPQYGGKLQPRALYVAKSPIGSKDYINKLDEKSSMQRLRRFASRTFNVTITKPMTINGFVDVCQHLMSMVEGPNAFPITLSNYKVELPARLKRCGYPLTISGSFLKCPNILSNFKTVLSIFMYLLDLLEPEDDSKPSKCAEAYLECFHNKITESQLRDELFMIKGMSNESDGMKLTNEWQRIVEEKSVNAQIWKKKLEAIQLKSEECQTDLKGLEDKCKTLQTRRQCLKSLRRTFNEKSEDYEKLQPVEAELSARFKALKEENLQEGFTREEFERLSSEIVWEERAKELRKDRADAIRKQNADVAEQREMKRAHFQRMLFETNTKAMLKLPKELLPKLLIDEKMQSWNEETIGKAISAANDILQEVREECKSLKDAEISAANKLTLFGRHEERLNEEYKQLDEELTRMRLEVNKSIVTYETVVERREAKLAEWKKNKVMVEEGVAKRQEIQTGCDKLHADLQSKIFELEATLKTINEHKLDLQHQFVDRQLKDAKKEEATLKAGIKQLKKIVQQL